MPLVTPYRLSYRTFEEFEPILVEVRDDAGNSGFGEGHISPGSSHETREGGWNFACSHAAALAGLDPNEAVAMLEREIDSSPVATTALTCALEMIQTHPLLEIKDTVRLPLLAPVSGRQRHEIEAEIEKKLASGFRTFKVKVGADLESDLARLSAIQGAVGDRATLRVDANRGFSEQDAVSFATRIEPAGIELFEQPCDADDWDANAAVAKVSRVPVMLDEPICAVDDIERAATLEGVGYVKLKLKRLGGIKRLHAALVRTRELGLTPVLGDGLGSEPMCWMEACVARSTIDNAGEFNGFLKARDRLFRKPLGFDTGDLVMPPGFRPELDPQQLDRLTIECVNIE